MCTHTDCNKIIIWKMSGQIVEPRNSIRTRTPNGATQVFTDVIFLLFVTFVWSPVFRLIFFILWVGSKATPKHRNICLGDDVLTATAHPCEY